MEQFELRTAAREIVPVTHLVQQAVGKAGLQNGLCLVYCPHTTAGVTINENADPDVARDLLFALAETFPDRPGFRHMEGNSSAHLQASMVGPSVGVPVQKGKLCLGQWQGIFFCEFDGPRHRRFWVQTAAE